MSDDEIEKLKAALASKAAYANEMLSAWQRKDGDYRRLSIERAKLMERIEDLEKKLGRAEGRLADRERDHYVLMDAFKLLTRAYHEGSTFADEIEASMERGEPTPKLEERLREYRTQVAQAEQSASDAYALKTQERILLKIFKEGLTGGVKGELQRFLASRMEYFRDADHWQEALELLEAEDSKKEIKA